MSKAKVVPIKARSDISTHRPVIEITQYGNQLCYEQCGKRWFRSSRWAVEDALARFQSTYDNIDCVSLWDLHNELDIIASPRDDTYGWNSAIHGGGILISTDLRKDGFLGMDEPVLVLIPHAFPEKDYKDYI